MRRYLYAHANPNYFIDPTGLAATVDAEDLQALGESIKSNRNLERPSAAIKAILTSNNMANQIQQTEFHGGNVWYDVDYINPATSAAIAQLIASASTGDKFTEFVVVEEGDDQSTVMTEINDRLGAYSKKVSASVAQKTSQVQPGMVIDISSMVNEASSIRRNQMMFTASVDYIAVKENTSLLSQAFSLPGRILVSAFAESEKVILNNSLSGLILGQAPRNLRNSANVDATIGSLFAAFKVGKYGYDKLKAFNNNKRPSYFNSIEISSGEMAFKRWKRGEAIDKPLPNGEMPTWDTVRSRYWKNRYEESFGTGEFSSRNLRELQKGNAPLDYNPRTNQFERRELHHVVPQRFEGGNNPINLRELTPDQHGAVDPFRHTVPTTTGIR